MADIDPKANTAHFYLDVPSYSHFSLTPENSKAVFFADAGVAIYANGHVEYDESKTDESARKFWEAVKKYIIGETK